MPSPPPRLLLIDPDPVRRAPVVAALAAAGWAVDAVADGAAARRALAAGRYALVLIDGHDPGSDGLAAVATLRAAPAPDRLVPIVLLAAHPPDDTVALPLAIDGRIAIPCPAARLAAGVAPWWPGTADPTRAALAAVFGAAAVDDLVARFLRELADALLHIDADDRAARAHRIAGLAGTLGFADVHDAWLALSFEEAGAAARAAIAARRALRSG